VLDKECTVIFIK